MFVCGLVCEYMNKIDLLFYGFVGLVYVFSLFDDLFRARLTLNWTDCTCSWLILYLAKKVINYQLMHV